MDFGQLTENEFTSITEAILELSDVCAAFQNSNIEWFQQNKSLAICYGGLCQKLAALQKRLSGKCGVSGF